MSQLQREKKNTTFLVNRMLNGTPLSNAVINGIPIEKKNRQEQQRQENKNNVLC